MFIKTLFILLLAAIITGGGFYLVKKSFTPSNQETAMMTNQEAVSEDENKQAALNSGSYIDYSSQDFAANQNHRRILFFYASWCPTCRPADADFQANKDKLPEDVVLFRVNYDTETELKEKYNITYQHTFVQVDENGSEIARWNGGQISELLSNLK